MAATEVTDKGVSTMITVTADREVHCVTEMTTRAEDTAVIITEIRAEAIAADVSATTITIAEAVHTEVAVEEDKGSYRSKKPGK